MWIHTDEDWSWGDLFQFNKDGAILPPLSIKETATAKRSFHNQLNECAPGYNTGSVCLICSAATNEPTAAGTTFGDIFIMAPSFLSVFFWYTGCGLV